eukprot:8236758-Pyramimonas_sp.AAC.1
MARLMLLEEVARGDPASMILFCLGTAPLQIYISKRCWEYQRLKLEYSDDCAHGIRDDIARLGHLSTVIQFLEPAVGLALNVHECLVLVRSTAFQARLKKSIAEPLPALMHIQVVLL